jgi:TRAP-type uncharacterized transport system fused permease subunit
MCCCSEIVTGTPRSMSKIVRIREKESYFTGGQAKAAVVASSLQGMVSGSSVANTVGSGSFTIPMMKKAGYKPEFAAAVEASASTGGQVMPPVMGAAAFYYGFVHKHAV